MVTEQSKPLSGLIQCCYVGSKSAFQSCGMHKPTNHKSSADEIFKGFTNFITARYSHVPNLLSHYRLGQYIEYQLLVVATALGAI